MQLGCTTKLRDHLKVLPAAADPNLDPFFTWTATLMTKNRRKVIVINNDKVHCGFVLYGITAPIRRDLNRHILEGIHQMLYDEGIAPNLINQYIMDCGEQISYTKTRDRSTVAKFNRFVMDLEYYQKPWDEGELYQPRIAHWINGGAFKDEFNYRRIREALCQEFMDHYACNTPYARDMVVISINLSGADCSRTLRVPLNYNLAQLHDVIQKAFCWSDTHSHAFLSQKSETLPTMFPEYAHLARGDEWDYDFEPMEHAITLQEMFAAESKFTYLYDLGDNWEHTIEFVRMELDCSNPFCYCLLANGDAPPEDVGGEFGFKEFCKVMNDPHSPEYNETREWAIWQHWNPLDVKRMNLLLKNI